MENSDSMLFDNPSERLVREVLTGEENYFLWKKKMESVLGMRNMLGFVNGNEVKPSDPDGLSKWDQRDALVLCWIWNSVSERIEKILVYCEHACEAWEKLKRMYGNRILRKYKIFREMRELVQGEMSLKEYYGRWVKLWDELDCLDGIDSTKCAPGEECSSLEKWKKRRESDKVVQFLTGMNRNEYLLVLISEFLFMDPLPSVDVVFSKVLDNEMLRNIREQIAAEASGVNTAEQMYDADTGERNESSNRNGSRKSTNRRTHVCGYCGIRGHLKDNCYKLVGYPPGHRCYGSQ